ncbi:MAG: hypothetical protein ACPGVD_09775 [Flavobacteriales bacterium]
MNLKLRIVSILIFLLCSCHQFKKVDTSVNSIKKTNFFDHQYFITECDSIRKGKTFTYLFSRFQVNTFANSTKVYCSPSGDSKVIDSIPFNSMFRGQIIVNNNGVNWLDCNIKGNLGYVKRNDIEKAQILSDYGLWCSLGYNSNSKKNEIKIFNRKNYNVVSGSFSFDSIFKYDELKQLKYVNIGQSKNIFSYKTYTETVPKKSFEQFILVDTNNKDIIPIANSYTNEGDYYYSDVISEYYYLPAVFPNGDTLHVQNGDVNNIFDEQNAKLKIWTIPDSISKSKKDIVVRKFFQSIHQLDKKSGEPMYDADGDEIRKYIYITEYYRWSNNKLNLIRKFDF